MTRNSRIINYLINFFCIHFFFLNDKYNKKWRKRNKKETEFMQGAEDK